MDRLRWLSDRSPESPLIDGFQQVLPRVWRATAPHPDWQPGEDWPQTVAWHAVATPSGAVLIDPLLRGGIDVDCLIERLGGCAAIIRTVFWHHRSSDELAQRFDAPIWARPGEPRAKAHDRALVADESIFDALVPYPTSRSDEVVLWLPEVEALIAGDVLLRAPSGRLQLCPDSWLAAGGRPALAASLRPLLELPVRHVLVSHGELLLGRGMSDLRSALKQTE